MGDKRIQRTKEKLKKALVSLLAKSTFEHISVTNLCLEASVSRFTFYSYYSDKYELADEFFKDMLSYASNDLKRLQKENNPDNDPIKSYCNLLDSIFNLSSKYVDFFSHINNENNPYLYFSYHWYILRSVEQFALEYSKVLKPNYSLKRTTSFICNGIWGFIQNNGTQKCLSPEVREDAKNMLICILKSGVFEINGKTAI